MAARRSCRLEQTRQLVVPHNQGRMADMGKPSTRSPGLAVPGRSARAALPACRVAALTAPARAAGPCGRSLRSFLAIFAAEAIARLDGALARDVSTLTGLRRFGSLL